MLRKLYSPQKYICRLKSVALENKKNVELFINDKPVVVPAGTSIMDACKTKGINVPHFCYHERLNIAGNCRMCLVEVNKSPKPIAACAMPVANGMKVYPDSDLSKQAREGVMEFLLVNHPLDCPICDEGGECELQNQSMKYGSDRSRFVDMEFTGKRAVPQADFGPLVKPIMTRCIHCTRCIRFAREIAGCEDLGTTSRGNNMEVGTFLQGTVFKSELSGNVIDLCPVGALTSHPYSFAARSWELMTTDSIDVMDALGSNIKINTRADELMRILPKINEDINEEWISDKCRFSYDGLKRQRLLEPMIRSEDTKLLKKCHWKVALQHIAKNINVKDNIAAICGPFVDVETMVATKDLLNKFDSELICLDENFDTSAAGCDFRSSYLLGPKIKDIENSDLCFIIGTNPRYESPLLNARIRKGWLQKNNKIVYVGPKVDLNYDYEHAGESIDVLGEIMKGQHKLSKAIKKSSSPIVIVGENYFNYQTNGTAKYNNIVKFSNYLKINSTNPMMDSINFGVIHKSASTVGALEMNICPNISILKDTPIKVLLLIGCDKENVLNQVPIDSDAFIIYIGHHGDHGALISDVVLPSSAYTEKEATYLNNEGRSQKTNSAIFPSGASRDDWKIITAISHILEKPLKYESIAQLKERLNEISPNFQNYNGTCNMDLNSLILKLAQPKPNKVIKAIEVNQKQLSDYYLTDVISRSSLTMNKAYQATKQ